jgi:hypothetical protein
MGSNPQPFMCSGCAIILLPFSSSPPFKTVKPFPAPPRGKYFNPRVRATVRPLPWYRLASLLRFGPAPPPFGTAHLEVQCELEGRQRAGKGNDERVALGVGGGKREGYLEREAGEDMREGRQVRGGTGRGGEGQETVTPCSRSKAPYREGLPRRLAPKRGVGGGEDVC